MRLPSAIERYSSHAAILVVAIAYATTAARTVQGGDAGEFAAIGVTGDVPHPPGYPLYVLLVRALSWLPAESPAHRASLLSALFGTIAVALLQVACRAWGASKPASIAAILIFAVSPLAWRLSTEPEVFMLNVAIAMTLVTLAAPPLPPLVKTERMRVALLGLFAGLGLANHHTIVFLAPLGLTAAFLAARRSRMLWSSVLLGGAMLVVGLLPYLYLMYAARNPTACTWGDPSTFSGLLRHFLRADYGTFSLAASDRAPQPCVHLNSLAVGLLANSAGFVLLALALLLRYRKANKALAIAFAVTLLTTGPLFVARFNTPPVDLGARVVERFYLLPLSLLTVAASVGATIALESAKVRKEIALAAASLIFLLRGGVTARSRIEEAKFRSTTEAYVHDTLRIAPPKSILLVMGDDAIGGFYYARCALHTREDVEVITPHLLLTDWYWPRVTSRLQMATPITHGIRPTPKDDPVLDGPLLVRDLLQTGRPLLLNAWFSNTLPKRFPSYPYGPLIRITPPEAIPPPDTLLKETEELYKSLEVPQIPRAPRNTWAGARAMDYARPWNVLAEAFERDAEPVRAAYCRKRATALTGE